MNKKRLCKGFECLEDRGWTIQGTNRFVYEFSGAFWYLEILNSAIDSEGTHTVRWVYVKDEILNKLLDEWSANHKQTTF